MSEKKLWSQLKQGDKKALEEIYRTYFKDLARYGQSLVRDTNVVDDSIQDLFVELWNRRDKLSEVDAIKPYLIVALRRKIFRATKTIAKSSVEIEEHHFDIELNIDDLLVQGEQAHETQSKLKKAFDQLSPRQKEILYLKYYADLSYEDIATSMDLNYQSARNLVARAIKKLGSTFPIILLILALTTFFSNN